VVGGEDEEQGRGLVWEEEEEEEESLFRG